MCGIFGAVAFDRLFDRGDRDLFVKQTDLVSYRGPDSSGHMVMQTAKQTVDGSGGFDIFLGHRRLSIIDLSDAASQPLSDGKGRWIIFNGEIFNYVELRQELLQQGCQFQTASDTEVILKIYEVYGEKGFDRLNGMWAFALVDLPARRVVLSRDRFSIKPLYYTRRGSNLYFGSEIKQLLPFLRERNLNKAVMYRFLVQAVADYSPETFFEEIHAVKAKHNLVLDLDRNRVEESQYWEYGRSTGKMSASDMVDSFRETFIDSVRIRLRSDVPIGALVSGGLDSSALAVVAKDVLEVNLQTFSVVAENADYSEAPFVDVLVEHGIENKRLTLTRDRSLSTLDTVLYHNDEPFLGFHSVAQFQILEHIKRHTDLVVILSGQGGDECLLGYSKFFFFYIQQLLRSGRMVAAAQLFFASLLQGTTVRQFRMGEAKRYLPGRKFMQPPAFMRLRGEHEPTGLGSDLRQRQILDIDRYSVPVQTHFEDRNSMAHSLEMRTPFLDHRLVEMSLNLPPSLKLQAGWSKYVLRKALPEIPEKIRWRRDKQGFLTPEELWLRTELKGEIQQMFSGSLLQQLGVVDDKKFLEHYARFLGGSATIGYGEISRLFLAERWARIFLNCEQPAAYEVGVG
ncbi:MAG: asparagine synthase (glutamine-hydrolyzing) [Terriglobales bacterium]